MTEFNSTESYSLDKYNTLIKTANEQSKDIQSCAEIIYKLETESSLSLDERDQLKGELGKKVDAVKSLSNQLQDTLSTEYHLYESTKPRIHQDLSGLQMLKEKVVDKNKDYSSNETLDDSAFFYRDE